MQRLTSVDALRRIAMFGLPGNVEEPFEVDSLEQLLMRADAQRVAIRLDRAVSHGMVVTDDAQWKEACRNRAIAAAETTLAAHSATVHAMRLLHDIEAIVIKGCATGPLDYPDPVTRFSSDVDMLVAAEDLDATVSRLGHRVDVPRSAKWHDRFGHAVTVAGTTGVEIDVHVRANHGYVGLSIPVGELGENLENYEIGGQRMASLDCESRLILAAVHADGVHRSLHALRDVPQLILHSGADWEAAVERSCRWRIDGFFARGITAAWIACGLDPHPVVDWARQHQPSGRQRVAVRFSGDRSQVLAGPLALPLRRWPGYVGPLLVPRRRYVEHGGKNWAERRQILRNELGRNADP